MTPEYLTATFAGVTLLIYFTASLIGAVVFIFKKIDRVKDTILADVAIKHRENDQRHNALQQIVIRHDAWINPEYNGNFGTGGIHGKR